MIQPGVSGVDPELQQVGLIKSWTLAGTMAAGFLLFSIVLFHDGPDALQIIGDLTEIMLATVGGLVGLRIADLGASVLHLRTQSQIQIAQMQAQAQVHLVPTPVLPTGGMPASATPAPTASPTAAPEVPAAAGS